MAVEKHFGATGKGYTKNSLKRKCTTNTFGVCHQLRFLAAFTYTTISMYVHVSMCIYLICVYED